MTKRLQDAAWLTGLVIALCVGLVWTSQAGSHASTATFSTTRAKPTPARAYAMAHAFDHYTTRAVIVHRDANGHLLSRHVYRTASGMTRAMSKVVANGHSDGPGGCFGNYGGTITKYGNSVLGFHLYHVKETLQYGYDCLAHDVNVISQSKDWGVDDHTWAWDGWDADHTWSHAYAWQTGRPNSGWTKRATGQFHGPCISTSVTCHEYPWVLIKAHADGSNDWDTGSM